MHVIEILNNMHVRDSVEGFVEVNEGSKDSMWLLEIKRCMNEVQELDKIVNN